MTTTALTGLTCWPIVVIRSAGKPWEMVICMVSLSIKENCEGEQRSNRQDRRANQDQVREHQSDANKRRISKRASLR